MDDVGGIIHPLPIQNSEEPFFKYSSIRTELTFITAILGGLAFLHSKYYIAKSLKVAIERDKLSWSFNIAKELGNIDVVKIRTFLEKKITSTDIPPSEFYNKIVSDIDVHSSTKMLLGLFEDSSVAVQSGLADEESLFRSLGYLVPWAFRSFSLYIEQVRKETGDDRIYCELEKLHDSWKNKTSLLSGKQY